MSGELIRSQDSDNEQFKYKSVAADLAKQLQEQGFEDVDSSFKRMKMVMDLVDETCKADYSFDEREKITTEVYHLLGVIRVSDVAPQLNGLVEAQREEIRRVEREKNSISADFTVINDEAA